MQCREVKRRLTVGTVDAEGPVARHLAKCPSCARLAERLRAAREVLRNHHVAYEPDARFANRVAARLNGAPAANLGWAAVRVLPATLVLLVLLVWLSWQTTSNPTSLFEESPTEDLLTWVLDQAGEGS